MGFEVQTAEGLEGSGRPESPRDHGAAARRPQADSWTGCLYSHSQIRYLTSTMDVSLFWKELVRVTDLGCRWSGCGWR
eukprot:1153484-Pelagomonas_calceolata.AAC.1